jgi:hypothetical protein
VPPKTLTNRNQPRDKARTQANASADEAAALLLFRIVHVPKHYAPDHLAKPDGIASLSRLY